MQQHHKIIQGDVLELLQTLPSNFFDAVLSDPPYGINFMGKEWDRGVPSAEAYTELNRVLKPGAFGLHFGGTRMWHRLAVNLEDAGFELRDTVMWLYGSGFPKSHNISKALDKAAGAEREVVGERKQRANGKGTNGASLNDCPSHVELLTAPATEAAKQWDGWGTALKPAWEPALLVQKPLDKTFANNVLAHGCGGLNIDGCRVGSDTISAHNAPKGTFAGGDEGRGSDTASYTEHTGRFPANLILDKLAGAALDEQSGTRPAGNFPTARGVSHIGFASGQATEGGARKMADKGGASRFFYCAKVSSRERNAGCDGFDAKQKVFNGQSAESSSFVEGSVEDRFPPRPAKNAHPTLKPIALTTYLAKLLLVPARTDGTPRRILVPFSGAGSEVIGCLLAGWDEVWGIEIDPEHCGVSLARIEHHTQSVSIQPDVLSNDYKQPDHLSHSTLGAISFGVSQ